MDEDNPLPTPISPRPIKATTSIPTPPAHLFRVISRVSSTTSPTSTASYLCLPRSVPPQKALKSKKPPKRDTSHQGHHNHLLKSLGPLESAVLTHQPPLLPHLLRATTLTHSLSLPDTSSLTPATRAYLPHLVLVTVSDDPASLRKQYMLLEELHAGRDEASTHLALAPCQSQFTGCVDSSWFTTPPVFGTTFSSLRERTREIGVDGLLGLVANVLFAGLESLEYLHASGYVHGNICAETVRANLHDAYFARRGRGYPDVVLTDLLSAREASEEGVDLDVRRFLSVMGEMMQRYSDIAPLLTGEAGGGGMEADNPAALVLAGIRSLLSEAKMLRVADVKEAVGAKLDDMKLGTEVELGGKFRALFHDDLVTEQEMKEATRKPVVLKMRRNKEELGKLRDGAILPEGSCVGMRTKRILAVRFLRKKEEFRELIGRVAGMSGNAENATTVV